MATTYSHNAVVAGEPIVDNDVNIPFATIFAALNSFDGENIQTNTIPGDRPKDGTIAGSKLTDTSVAGTKLQNTTVAGGKLVAGTVGTTQLADAAVTTAKLADGAVTLAKLTTGLDFERISVDTFVGDHALSRVITIDWQPMVVVICGLGVNHVYLKTADMPASDTRDVSGNLTLQVIQIESTGFTVYRRPDLNQIGVTYYYFALGST